MFILSVVVLVCIQSSSYGGILRTGNPLSWNIAKPVLNSVRLSGIKQFIYHYNRSKDIKTPLFLWGDELEYGLFSYDEKSNRFDLSLRGRDIREELLTLERGLTDLKSGCEWQPEYGSWMIEAVPRDPYGGYVSDLLQVEKNMQLRRRRLHAVLRANEIAPTTANFPMMGVKGYSHTIANRGLTAYSAYVSDDVINPHPRFGTLTRNIRQRRQGNVNIRIAAATQNLGVLRQEDVNEEGADWQFKCCDDSSDDLREMIVSEGEKLFTSQSSEVTDSKGKVGESKKDSKDENIIHMDAMAFGMGCCCLQVTMQANDDRESRFVHDQLALLAPLFLALSASTPIFRGTLAGTDTRWDVISQSVDDRTDRERGEEEKLDEWESENENESQSGSSIAQEVDPELVAGGVKRLFKSRYSSVSRFIGKTESDEEQRNIDALNDLDANMDEEAFQILLDGGLDRSLASHIAHLFVRDPLVIFDDAIDLDNETAMDHFENIQSTNWRTMRWKSPALEMGLEAERRKTRHQTPSTSMNSVEKISSASATEEEVSKMDVNNVNKIENGKEVEKEEEEKDIQTFGPGWRVEFRPLEIQLTDFENAAFSLLTVLTTRSLLAIGYNFYLPVSLMEENMMRAQQENAVMTQKFWVRKESFSPSLTTVPLTVGNMKESGSESDSVKKGMKESDVREFGTIKRSENMEGGSVCLVPKMADITAIELTLDEFFNGRPGTAIDRAAGRQGEAFPGLIPAIYGYLEALGCNALTIGRLRPYLNLLQKKASGELPTTAQWMRTFVRSHREYKGDGIVSPGIANDLLMLCDDIGMGRVQRPDLLGDALIELLCPEGPRVSTATPSFSSSSSMKMDKSSGSQVPSSSPIPLSTSMSASASSSAPSSSSVSTSVSTSGSARQGVKKSTCASYTPISVCSRNVVSCFREGQKGQESDTEPAVQVPWIAHVLMGSGSDPDTYLDINLVQ